MKKSKLAKFVQAKKVPLMVASGVLLAGLAGGTYYLAAKQDGKFGKTDTSVKTTTDSQVQENVQSKADAATIGDTATTSPTATATTPAVTSLNDVSLSILLDTDKTQAYVYLYGPAGTYGLEKLVSGSWQTVVASTDYSGHGGNKQLAIITSAETTTHFRVFKLMNGNRTAVSGDTAVTWQDILTNGTLTVPLAG